MAEKRKREELRSRETEEHGTAEKRNRADLLSGGTEWICLALSRRGMDANCREQNGEAMCGRETEWRSEVESRDGKDMTRKH